MKKPTLKNLFMFLLIFSSSIMSAQDQPAMADVFRQEGKIYVVIGVIAIIFISLVIFLISIERRISKLEKRTDTTSST